MVITLKGIILATIIMSYIICSSFNVSMMREKFSNRFLSAATILILRKKIHRNILEYNYLVKTD